MPAYHASKGAVRLMSKTDALAYAPDRIRVNSVHPGYIWTPMVEHHLRASGATDLDAARDDVGKLHPLGHMGEPDDIAWGVVYLASDESKFVTGAELVIDGGYTARGCGRDVAAHGASDSFSPARLAVHRPRHLPGAPNAASGWTMAACEPSSCGPGRHLPTARHCWPRSARTPTPKSWRTR